MDDKLNNSGSAPSGCSAAIVKLPVLRTGRRVVAFMAAISCLMVSLTAESATVYSQAGTTASSASAISSNATNLDGSDGDVTAYDNFTLRKSANISSVSWRGSSSNAGLAGFTICIYASKHDPAAQADTSSPLGTINVEGNASEKQIGNNISDFGADFNEPLVLKAGVQYWISIVANRNDLSSWGWANGTGGDGRSIQSFAELRILSAPGDRAFSLYDGHSLARK